MNKCCECEHDGPVLLGPKDHQSSYCEEHAIATIERRKYNLWQYHVQEIGYLDWELEQAIAAASSP